MQQCVCMCSGRRCLYGHSEHALSPREPDRFNEGTILAANIYKIQFRRRRRRTSTRHIFTHSAHTNKITNILFIVALNVPSTRFMIALRFLIRDRVALGFINFLIMCSCRTMCK
jgi:hypothetical protein